MKDTDKTQSFRETIGYYSNTEFYRVGRNLFFGKDRVHPEFEILMRLKFITHTSIRFKFSSFKREKSDKQRYDLINKIISPLNDKIKKKYPHAKTGKHGFRYCWVNEYGDSENEVHMHILGFIKPDLIDLLFLKSYNYLKYLEKKHIYEIESLHTRKVNHQAGIVSYFCKIEPNIGQDNFKKIGYSKGFQSVIKKFYTRNSFKK
jgi:hypothetical protein